MTDARNRVVLVPSLLSLLVLLGFLTSVAPGVAASLVSALLLLCVLTRGVQTLYVMILFAFPLIPSQLHLGVSSLYPQRLLLGVFLLVLLADRELWHSARWRIARMSTPLRFLTGFLAVGLVSAVRSPLPAQALGGVGFYLLHVGGAFLIGLVASRRSHEGTYWTAVSLCALVVAVISLAEFLGPANLLTGIYPQAFLPGQFAGDATRAIASRVSGPLGHPVALGTYAMMTLPFGFQAATQSQHKTAQIGRAAVVALLITLLLSQTRMAMLAAIVAAGVWFAFAKRRRNVTVVVAVSVVVAIASFGMSALRQQGAILQQALSYRGQTSSSNPAFNSIAARSSIYETGWRAFQAEPLVGFGYRLPTADAQSPIFARYGEPYAFESYMVVLPVESGVIGTLLFIGFIITLVMAAARYIPDRTHRATIVSAVVGCAALSVGSNPFDVPITYLWLLLGLCFGIGMREVAAVTPAEGQRRTAAWVK
jgi:flagellin-like protein